MRQFSPVEFTVVAPLELPENYPKDSTNLSQLHVVGVRDEDKWSISAVQYHRLTDKEPQPILGLIETVTDCDQESAFDTSVKWVEESEASGWVPDRTNLTIRYPERRVEDLMFGRFLMQVITPGEKAAAASPTLSRSARAARHVGAQALNQLLHP